MSRTQRATVTFHNWSAAQGALGVRVTIFGLTAESALLADVIEEEEKAAIKRAAGIAASE